MAEQISSPDLASGTVPTTLRRVRLWAGRLGGIVFSLLLTWLMLEILMRVGFNALPPWVRGAIENVQKVPWNDARIIPLPPLTPDRDYQNILIPNLHQRTMYFSDGHFSISTITLWGGRVGFRSDPPQWPVDIVAVGDSFTVCFTAFEDCWVERLHRDDGWSVMNLGQIATGSRAHLQVLTTFGTPLEPRIVLWQWYGNDFNEDYGLALLRGETQPLDTPPQLASQPDHDWLAKYSTVYATLRAWWHDRKPDSSPDHTITVHGHHLTVGDSYTLYSHDLSRPSNAYGWERTVQALDAAAQAAREEMHATLVVILIPAKEEVYADESTAVLGQVYMDILRQGHERMLALCEERGWICIDPTEALQAEARTGRMVYYDLDSHLNPNGNRILAGVVADYLVARGLLSK